MVRIEPRMFFGVGEDQELMIHNSKAKGIIYELYDVILDKDGNTKKKKKAADKEVLWRMAYGISILDCFEKRRKPHALGLTEDQFVQMKHQEVMYGAHIVQSDDFFNGWMKQYSNNSEKKYRLLMNDFVLYLLDYHYDDFLLVDMKKIELYIDNCIKRQRKEKVVLDTIAVLKNFAIEHRINFVRNDFEELRSQVREHLHVGKVLYSAGELMFFDWLFELLINKRDAEMREINNFTPLLPGKKGELGTFIASRRVRIRRIIYNMITELFLNYSEIERLMKQDVHFDTNQLYIREKDYYVDLSDEMAVMIEEYLDFRENFDVIVYEEKIIRCALLQSKIKLATGQSIEWHDLLEKSDVDAIEYLHQVLKNREKDRKKAIAAGEEYIPTDDGEGSDTEIEEKIYRIIINSKKRKEITKKSYVEVEELFVSVNSRGLKSKGMREMISRFVRYENVNISETKDQIEMFVYQNNHLSSDDRNKNEFQDDFMNQFASVFFRNNNEAKQDYLDYVKSSKEVEEVPSDASEIDTEEQQGYQDHNLLKESAIAVLKNNKKMDIGEIERRIRTKL